MTPQKMEKFGYPSTSPRHLKSKPNAKPKVKPKVQQPESVPVTPKSVPKKEKSTLVVHPSANHNVLLESLTNLNIEPPKINDNSAGTNEFLKSYQNYCNILNVFNINKVPSISASKSSPSPTLQPTQNESNCIQENRSKSPTSASMNSMSHEITIKDDLSNSTSEHVDVLSMIARNNCYIRTFHP